MTNPTEQIAAWNQATYEAALNYARTSLATAEELLKLNLETTRASLDQAAKATRDLMSINDPQQLMAVRSRLAQTHMQHAATYAQSVYAIVSQTQQHLSRMYEEQMGRFSRDMASGADALGKGLPGMAGIPGMAGMPGMQGMPGADFANTAVKSTLAATSAMMESLNQATRQFAELSESAMKAAASQMVNKGDGKS